MRKLATKLPDVWELRPEIVTDARGVFIQSYCREKFENLGIVDSFVQDNHSISHKNTIRGLHYQLRRPQAKICRVVSGRALDIAVDVRRGSPRFGQWASVLLSAEEANQIYIPAGFAHGFLALTEQVQFLYKCSQPYDAQDERGISWQDPHLNIFWGVASPILSKKDSGLPRMEDMSWADFPTFQRRKE